MSQEPTYFQFETERLFIRPMRVQDAPYILELLNTPKWMTNIGDRNVRNLNDAEEYIETKMLPQLHKLGFGNYAVIRKSDGVTVGNCGLYNREGIDGIDIGYALLPQYEKNGYAIEATTKLMEVAQTEFNINKISGITIKENIASQKILEKLGLVFKEIIKIPNDDSDLLLYVYHKNTNN